jgi:hypothetical protein
MAIFRSAGNQALKAHAHVADEQCPWCEQPIPHGKFEDITRRIEAKEREQHAEVQRSLMAEFAQKSAALEAKTKAALEQVRAEAAAAAEQKVAAAKAEAARTAEAAMLAKLAEIQAKLVHAEEAKAATQKQMATLKESQEAALGQRLQEAQEALQREKDTAVLAEKAKVLKLQSELQDMQRKLEGKSAHELGEGSEVDLFEELRDAFQGDRIQRVPKGVNGADVIHEVVHNGRVCGKIIYDAKNRDAWQNGYCTKLKADKLAQAADHAILSSNKFPKDRSQIHTQDGVIVANPARVLAIVEILRDQIVRMHELRISKEAREEKTVALYAFVTSDHFKQLVEQVEAQAVKMLDLDTKEQEAHRRLWDQRGKLIRSVQKARSDLTFEVDRIIGTAGNGPEEDAAA